MTEPTVPPAPAPSPPPAPRPPPQNLADSPRSVAKAPYKPVMQREVDESKVWNLWFTRKEFLTLTAWGAFLAGLGGTLAATLKYFIPNITYDPPTVFKIGKPEDYMPGDVDGRWKQKHRIWVVRDLPSSGGGLYVLFARCTHLGCTPNWLPGQNKFKCPCHGSGFRFGGINFEGPAPRPLERCQVALADDGQVVVDVGFRYKNPKDWKRSDAYLMLKG